MTTAVVVPGDHVDTVLLIGMDGLQRHSLSCVSLPKQSQVNSITPLLIKWESSLPRKIWEVELYCEICCNYCNLQQCMVQRMVCSEHHRTAPSES